MWDILTKCRTLRTFQCRERCPFGVEISVTTLVFSVQNSFIQRILIRWSLWSDIRNNFAVRASGEKSGTGTTVNLLIFSELWCFFVHQAYQKQIKFIVNQPAFKARNRTNISRSALWNNAAAMELIRPVHQCGGEKRTQIGNDFQMRKKDKTSLFWASYEERY